MLLSGSEPKAGSKSGRFLGSQAQAQLLCNTDLRLRPRPLSSREDDLRQARPRYGAWYKPPALWHQNYSQRSPPHGDSNYSLARQGDYKALILFKSQDIFRWQSSCVGRCGGGGGAAPHLYPELHSILQRQQILQTRLCHRHYQHRIDKNKSLHC